MKAASRSKTVDRSKTDELKEKLEAILTKGDSQQLAELHKCIEETFENLGPRIFPDMPNHAWGPVPGHRVCLVTQSDTYRLETALHALQALADLLGRNDGDFNGGTVKTAMEPAISLLEETVRSLAANVAEPKQEEGAA